MQRQTHSGSGFMSSYIAILMCTLNTANFAKVCSNANSVKFTFYYAFVI